MQTVTFSRFEWDQGNRRKCQKHGVSIDEIEYVLAHGEALVTPDPKSRGEPRYLGIGRTREGRYPFVVFTPRHRTTGTWLRPISARYMHDREIRKYAEETARAQKR